MELTLSPNVLHDEEQILRFDGLATLIGENGSGKSILLQSVFEKKLDQHADLSHLRVVCFSSGQNENFSRRFAQYLSSMRKKEDTPDLDCFYYDKSWSKLLIFLATILYSQGHVRRFLRAHGYLLESGTHRPNVFTDASTSLAFKFKVDKSYVDRVQNALEQEARGATDTLRSTPYFRALSGFIRNAVDKEYEFENTLRKTSCTLNSEKLFSVSVDGYKSNLSMASGQPVGISLSDVNPGRISFFTQLANTNYLFDRESMQLSFHGGLEMDQLSDGEYQILFLYALVDLFDSPDTLFLLDEADSHLHYQNIHKLWDTLKGIKGNAITTTHLLDSISSSGIDHVQVISRGRVVQEDRFSELVGRLNQLGFVQKAQFKVCSLIENIVLMDNADDWKIFMALAKKKLGAIDDRLAKMQVIDVPTGTNARTQPFGKRKIHWVEAFAGRSLEWQMHTKNIFLICDRDNLPLTDINREDKVRVNGINPQPSHWSGRNSPRVHLLSWRHREIENYLLSFTGLSNYPRGDLDAVNYELPEPRRLSERGLPDNDAIRDLDAKQFIHPIVKPVQGLCLDALNEYVTLIPPEEISEDIENMYRYIVSQL